MTFTANLVFLGPALGSVITSIYAVRTVRHDGAWGLHSEYVDRRLTLCTSFLDAVDACEAPLVVAREQKETATAVNAALQRLQLAFPKGTVTDAAQDAATWSCRLTSCPPPPPLGHEEILNRLRNMADNAEEHGAVRDQASAIACLDTLRSAYQDQENAAAKGEEDPAEQYWGDLYAYEQELEIDLSKALPSTYVRKEHAKASKAYTKASAEFTCARAAFVVAAAEWMHDPRSVRVRLRPRPRPGQRMTKLLPRRKGRGPAGSGVTPVTEGSRGRELGGAAPRPSTSA